MLHLHGIEVKPVTLEIGDYILSPEVCVERKAIPDLIQSLSSGRLFNQAEAMMRYYKRPALLIECEDHRPFGLINANELGPDIAPQALLSKLSLMLLHFPKMRLLWSRSPAHTVAIFAALKQGQAEPDAAAAASIGMTQAPGAAQTFNMAQNQGFVFGASQERKHGMYKYSMRCISSMERLVSGVSCGKQDQDYVSGRHRSHTQAAHQTTTRRRQQYSTSPRGHPIER